MVAPVSASLTMDKGDYYEHLSGKQNQGYTKGYRRDNLSYVQLDELYKVYQQKYKVAVCISPQMYTKQKGVRAFDFTIGQWQDCDDAFIKNVGNTRGCSKPGEYRVTRPDKEGWRDIIFLKEDSQGNYVKKARRLLVENYLYGGVFRIVDKQRKQVCEIKMDYNDCMFTSVPSSQIAKLLLVMGEQADLYEVLVCTEKGIK